VWKRTSGFSAAKTSINFVKPNFEETYEEAAVTIAAGMTMAPVDVATTTASLPCVGRRACAVMKDPLMLIWMLLLVS
jgi:hypothetical protein